MLLYHMPLTEARVLAQQYETLGEPRGERRVKPPRGFFAALRPCGQSASPHGSGAAMEGPDTAATSFGAHAGVAGCAGTASTAASTTSARTVIPAKAGSQEPRGVSVDNMAPRTAARVTETILGGGAKKGPFPSPLPEGARADPAAKKPTIHPYGTPAAACFRCRVSRPLCHSRGARKRNCRLEIRAPSASRRGDTPKART